MDRKYLKYKNKYLELKKLQGGFLNDYSIEANKAIIREDYILNELTNKLKDNNLFKKKNITNNSLLICKSLSFTKNSKYADISDILDITEDIYTKLITNTDEKYVDLYYSVPNKIFLINYILSKLESNNNSLLRSKNFNFSFTDAQNCLDSIQTIINDINTKNDFDINEKLIDKRPEYRSNLISTNLSLFGNEFFSDTGESTFNYYISQASQLELELNKLLDDFLFKYHYKIKLNNKHKILNMLKIIKDIKYSTIYQILIPKEKITKYTYLSYEYGKPFDNNNNNINHFVNLYLNKNFNELNLLINNTKTNLLSTKFYDRILDTKINDFNYCNPINLIQARIVISKELIDDQDIKINYYNKITDEMIKSIDHLCSELISDNTKDIKDIYENILNKIIKKFSGKNEDEIKNKILNIVNKKNHILINFFIELFLNNNSEIDKLKKHLEDNNVNINIIYDNLYLYYYYVHYFKIIILLDDDTATIENIHTNLEAMNETMTKSFEKFKIMPMSILDTNNIIIFNYSLIINYNEKYIEIYNNLY